MRANILFWQIASNYMRWFFLSGYHRSASSKKHYMSGTPPLRTYCPRVLLYLSAVMVLTMSCNNFIDIACNSPPTNDNDEDDDDDDDGCWYLSCSVEPPSAQPSPRTGSHFEQYISNDFSIYPTDTRIVNKSLCFTLLSYHIPPANQPNTSDMSDWRVSTETSTASRSVTRLNIFACVS